MIFPYNSLSWFVDVVVVKRKVRSPCFLFSLYFWESLGINIMIRTWSKITELLFRVWHLGILVLSSHFQMRVGNFMLVYYLFRLCLLWNGLCCFSTSLVFFNIPVKLLGSSIPEIWGSTGLGTLPHEACG